MPRTHAVVAGVQGCFLRTARVRDRQRQRSLTAHGGGSAGQGQGSAGLRQHLQRPVMGGGKVLLPHRQSLRQQPQHPGTQGGGGGQQRMAGQGCAGVRQQRSGLRVQIVVLRPQDIRRAADMGGRRGVDGQQLGHDLQPQAVAGIVGVQIRLVGDVGQVMRRDIGVDSGAGRVQQGADDALPHRWNAGKPLGAGAPQQLQQHRLRLILPVVGGGDEGRADGRGGAAQEFIAGAAACLLHGQAPCIAQDVHVHLFRVKGDIPLAAQPAHQLLVPLRRGAHAVVQVGGGHGKAPLLSQTPQVVQQAHGVPPSGYGAQDRPAGRREHAEALHPRRGVHHGLTHPRRTGSPACRRRCIPASSAAPPCPFRRGGSWLRCTRPRCASPCRRCSSRRGRGT